MNKYAIVAIAILGIFTTVYLVKRPLDAYSHPTPQQSVDEWRIKYEEQKKQLHFLEMWKACADAHGGLIVDSKGNAACALRRDRWITQ